ncbi:MAG: HAMP domain-containing protein [Sedimentisphaerales bacterium]|nr:HAMP domain-containing protein [Sedimentisphaerales bacterium]
MRLNLNKLLKLLELLRLWPLSLAEKCRLAFGAAVIFILFLALLLPYIWMGQLTKKGLLDTNKAKAETILSRLHFQLKDAPEAALPTLNTTGALADPNNPEIRWIRFPKDSEEPLKNLTPEQQTTVKMLKSVETRDDDIEIAKTKGLESNYIRIFRATAGCITCHNAEGSAAAFTLNEPVGIVIIRSLGVESEVSKTVVLNRIWIAVSWLIGVTGAIVAFYWITQRVILRPIRQLRALANNVAEGNLDTRSSIATRDEYEKLATAFNHMLDGLQAAQEKLREANRQLDAKIIELSERNIELFKANKVKSEFLANISHEFRTPLNAIMGFAQVLRDKPKTLKTDKGKKYAENIIISGNRLLSMINDLLDLAKTRAGKMELHIEKTSAANLCEGLVASFSLLTQKKKIKIKHTVDQNIPILTTDVGKVQQVLYNFLSNAVKFTSAKGRIEIQARMLDDKTARFAVSDTGCGIAEADKEKIFDKFSQVDGSITRESPGSGLGLTISNELAAMLAGDIGLESELDVGSTFWLDIPVTLTAEQDKPKSLKQI